MTQTWKIIIAIVITSLVVGGGVYWYSNSRQTSEISTEPENISNGETQKIEEVKISFISCIDSLYSDNRDQYDFWKSKFSDLYPNLKVYDAGAYCKLSNGSQLISFSHFSKDGTKAGQTIILFDKENNVLKNTDGFFCQTMGDLGYPIFKSVKDSKVTMTCSSGDAGQFLKQTYELNLDTFGFRLIDEDTSLPE